MVDERGEGENYIIESAATSTEEIGNPPHRGTVDKLREVGIPLVEHYAVQVTKRDYDKYDYLIGMDTYNTSNMTRIAGGDPDGKIYQMLSFAGLNRSIADPWYTDNFDETYNDLVEGLGAFMKFLQKKGI